MLRPITLAATLLLHACAASSPTGPTTTASASSSSIAPSITAAVASTARPEADRALDAGRRPAETLAFFGIVPGARVVDVFAGGGYTTELLARVVGPAGHVVAQNNTFVLDRFARAPLEARLTRLDMAFVTAFESPLDSPVPPAPRPFDAVLFILAYHDSVWQGTDRAAMNRAVFESLRSGGVYGIVDHAAAPGRGVADAQSLHRIEESVVVEEVLAAGFRLDAAADFLRNESDARDWNAAPSAAAERRGTSDRFVLRFVKP